MFNKYLYNCKNKTNNCLTINLIQYIPLNMELHKKINVTKIVITIFQRSEPHHISSDELSGGTISHRK